MQRYNFQKAERIGDRLMTVVDLLMKGGYLSNKESALGGKALCGDLMIVCLGRLFLKAGEGAK